MESRYVGPVDPRRRRTTRAIMGAAVAAVTLGASGIYIATAGADEVDYIATAGAAAPSPTLQAEAYAAESGAKTESTSDVGGGRNVGWLADGDWLEYRNVTITGTALAARIASHNTDGGSIEARLGSPAGSLLATFPVASTGGWQKWTTVTATAATVPTGQQTLVLVMKSGSRSDFVNINHLTVGAGTSPSPVTQPGTVPPVAAPSSAAPSSAAPSSATPSSAAPSSAAPSAPAGTTPTTTGPTGGTAPVAGGWVPVDEAAWKAELARHAAVPAKPVPAGIVRVPEFHTNCKVSGESPDDPIIFPNLAGASHLHTFFGPKVSASSTTQQLLTQPTTCDAAGDKSAYWAPTLLQNGKPVKMKDFRVYYGAKIKDPATVVPFPPGLVVVQGDAKRQVPTPKGASGQFWCAGSAEIGRSADGNWPRCAAGGNLIYQLTFQDCWDGKHIDSPDHKSHMGPAVNGVCTGKYPVAIPNLSMMLGYDSLGGDGLALSSGMASSIHGDFMNAWEPGTLSALVKVCINANAKCGTTPSFG